MTTERQPSEAEAAFIARRDELFKTDPATLTDEKLLETISRVDANFRVSLEWLAELEADETREASGSDAEWEAKEVGYRLALLQVEFVDRETRVEAGVDKLVDLGLVKSDEELSDVTENRVVNGGYDGEFDEAVPFQGDGPFIGSVSQEQIDTLAALLKERGVVFPDVNDLVEFFGHAAGFTASYPEKFPLEDGEPRSNLTLNTIKRVLNGLNADVRGTEVLEAIEAIIREEAGVALEGE